MRIFTVEFTQNHAHPGHIHNHCICKTYHIQSPLRNLSNMYNGLFSSEPCVTQAYSEPCQTSMMENFIHKLICNLSTFRTWHIQTPNHIQNTGKHVSLNILLKNLCNPEMIRTLVYSELWYILKSAYLCCQEKSYSKPYRISKMRHFIKNPV